MNLFFIKIIAILVMLLDHVTLVLGESWRLIPLNTQWGRIIPRIAFPIFAFCIVNGWKYTKNKNTYFLNIMLFAIISQIPFVTSFYIPNMMPKNSTANINAFMFNPIFLFTAALCTLTYWIIILDKKYSKTIWIVVIVSALPCLSIKSNHIWILMSDSLNVFYTLAIGIMVIFTIERIAKKELSTNKLILLSITACTTILFYGLNADYGYYLMGIALIVMLYLLRNKQVLQGLSIFIWGIVFYGLVIGNWSYALITLVSSLLIISYNNQLGYKHKMIKWGFYLFYPLHLMIIGLINIYLKFK